MYAKNAMVRVMFAVAAALATALSIGSVVATASHYEAAQLDATRAAVVAQRS